MGADVTESGAWTATSAGEKASGSPSRACICTARTKGFPDLARRRGNVTPTLRRPRRNVGTRTRPARAVRVRPCRVRNAPRTQADVTPTLRTAARATSSQSWEGRWVHACKGGGAGGRGTPPALFPSFYFLTRAAPSRSSLSKTFVLHRSLTFLPPLFYFLTRAAPSRSVRVDRCLDGC